MNPYKGATCCRHDHWWCCLGHNHSIDPRIEEKYCEIAVQRLAQGVLEFGVGSGTQ